MSTLRALSVKAEIDNSVQMQYLRELERLSELSIHNLRPPRFFATHSSTKSNLNVDKKVVYTEWASSVKWAALNNDVLAWCEKYLIESVFKEMKNYFTEKIDLSLSPFDPTIWIGNLVQYGKNDGNWTDLVWREFSEYIREDAKKLTWTSENILDTPRDITDWDELILAQPMFSILRHSATSAYPDYTKQSTKFIVSGDPPKYAQALDQDPLHNYVTSYHRRHGYSRKTDSLTGRVKLIEKDRWVGGVSFDNKIHGLPLTYSFKLSRPDFTPYYKPWNIVFQDLLSKYKNNLGNFVFTSDQSGFDMNHNSIVIKDTMGVIMEDMPDVMKRQTTNVLNACYNNPRLIMNARYYIRLGRWISTSGAPPTPLFETLNNIAIHRYALNKMDIPILSYLVQIDDSVIFTEREFDLHTFSKIIKDDLGFIINPDKTESSLRDFIVYLQILLGKLMKEPLPTVAGLEWEDLYGYIGHILRRIHRLRFKERLMQIAGDVIFIDEEGNDVTETPVCRFLGSLSSLGPMTPIDLIDIIVFHHLDAYYYIDGKKFKLIDEVVKFCKSKAIAYVREFGFDPLILMQYFRNNY